MTWNFWAEAHSKASKEVVFAIMPKWSNQFVGSATLLIASSAGVITYHAYALPGRTALALVLSSVTLLSVPILYAAKMVRYPADVLSRLNDDVRELRGRLHAKDVAESSIIALSEYLAEMKLLQGERVRTPEQHASWTERYHRLIQATYVILSKGVSNNVAMVYVSCPVVEPRYIRGCFNDDHMRAAFALEKYVDKLQCIIDGHFLTLQHTRIEPHPVGHKVAYTPLDGGTLLAA